MTRLGETVSVDIVTRGDRSASIEIGAEGGNLYFTEDPVEIESSVNDTFDHLLRSQATIRLLTRDFISDFFCTSCMDAVVNISKGGECVFAGFIEPQAYQQGYNEVFDTLELSCIDALSALQYSKYRKVGDTGVDYAAIKASAGQVRFSDIMGKILNGVCANIDIADAGGIECYYDGSKALTATADRYEIFEKLAISELLFLGDDEDDVWQQDEVLEAMLKYLNLHIIQQGLRFYIFSWETVKNGAPIAWRKVMTKGTEPVDAEPAANRPCINIGLDNAASDDTSISIGEVYNQMLLTCKIEEVEDLISSPLDSDSLVSPYTNRQKYMTEYSADGEGFTAHDALHDMVSGKPTDYKNVEITDWYIKVKDNPNWIFPTSTGENAIDKYCQRNLHQERLPNMMAAESLAAIVSMGKVSQKTDRKDNSPVSKIDMTDYLVISVNGNGKDDENETYPTETSLRDRTPMAIYTGPTTGSIYSPADESTKNYIVISGKIILNPVMGFTANFADTQIEDNWRLQYNFAPSVFWNKTVPSRNNKDGRYYTQKYYKAATPHVEPEWDASTSRGLVPFTGTGPQLYEFKYSAVGDATDKVSKVAVLACMLIVGNKCAVEVGNNGDIKDIKWLPYKSREQCASDDEYYEQCFTIGFDPKIGDKLIGTEFDLQNNIDYTMGIDAEGIAIPIQKKDQLSGPVKFMILGPVNTVWDEITRRHKTWFRREKWSGKAVPLLAHVSNIIIKSLEIKVYSDNGKINDEGDNDIVYMSDTNEAFVNRKDDIDFEINSALTLDECRALGIADSVRLSMPLDLSTDSGLLSIYDHGKQQQAKPEQLYVDSYYTEYHKPRLIMTQKIDDRDGLADIFNIYRHPSMANKNFYVQSISRNLIESIAELTLKEVWYD